MNHISESLKLQQHKLTVKQHRDTEKRGIYKAIYEVN